jgi:hypothetical protein
LILDVKQRRNMILIDSKGKKKRRKIILVDPGRKKEESMILNRF